MPTRSIVFAILSIAALAFVCAGCHSDDHAKNDQPKDTSMTATTITGSVTYRARIALPPDAVVNVRLEDVSKADAPATMIAERFINTEGRQVPIPFSFVFDADKIESNRRYQVRATIKSGDNLLFTTTSAYPVLTHGAGSHVDIVVEQARAGDTKPRPSEPIAFENSQWRLTEINGQPALPSEGPRQAGIMFISRDNTIAANTSINVLGGEYTLKGGVLSISPGMMTMMAGPEPLMNQERAFLAALGKVTSYRIKGETMDLLAGDKVVMTFVASSE